MPLLKKKPEAPKTRTSLAATPASRMSPRAYKWARRAIVGAAVGSFLCGPVAMLYASRAGVVQNFFTQTYPTQVAGFASSVAETYLAGECTNLPVADGVDRCFGRTRDQVGVGFPHETVELVRTETTTVPGSGPSLATAYITTFNVTSGERVYELAVTATTVRLTETSADYPVLAAAPSLIPAKVAPTDRIDALDYREFNQSLAVPVPVRAKVEQWVNAYATDDQTQLRLIVGGGPDAPYPGLGGMEVLRSTAESMWQRQDGDHVVRVGVVLTSPSANGVVLSSEFDLLVSQANTNDPRVVAWGAAGSGPTLTTYMNNQANG